MMLMQIIDAYANRLILHRPTVIMNQGGKRQELCSLLSQRFINERHLRETLLNGDGALKLLGRNFREAQQQ